MRISKYLEATVADPKRELAAKLAEVEAAARLVSVATNLRPRLSEMIRWDELKNYEKKLVGDFIRLHDANSRTVFISLVVICYGSLEDFLRELVERAVLAINASGSHVENLPVSLFEENIYRTGQVLQTVKAKRAESRYDFIALARTLGSCDRTSGSFSLNAECFSFGQGIVSPGGIENSLARVGVSLNWDQFGADAAVRSVLGEMRTRDCAKAARVAVEELVKARNVVSHTGGLEIEVGEDEVFKYTRFLLPFCGVLVKEVGKQLDAKCG